MAGTKDIPVRVGGVILSVEKDDCSICHKTSNLIKVSTVCNDPTCWTFIGKGPHWSVAKARCRHCIKQDPMYVPVTCQSKPEDTSKPMKRRELET